MPMSLYLGKCIVCDRLFMCDPDYVPSVLVDGQLEPLCQPCVDYVNPMRMESGLDPIVAHPLAYQRPDEAD